MIDITTDVVMKDIREGVSPEKYEKLESKIFNIILNQYYKHNIIVLIKYYIQKGLTQKEISKKLEISQSSVYRKIG